MGQGVRGGNQLVLYIQEQEMYHGVRYKIRVGKTLSVPRAYENRYSGVGISSVYNKAENVKPSADSSK